MKLGSRIAAGLLTVSLGALVGSQPLTVQESPWRCPAARSLIAELEGPLAHVRYLADDLLEGRAVATRGERCAGDYIAARFRALGLEPAGDGDSFFQAWMVRTGSETGDGNSFAVSGDAPARFVLGADWTPYGFSASARVGALMAVVPAVTDGQLEDSGHGTLAGKALVIEGAAPHPHAAPVDAHRVGSSAAGMGAAAVIILLGDSDPLPPLADERRAPLAVQVVAVRGAAAAMCARRRRAARWPQCPPSRCAARPATSGRPARLRSAR